MTVQELAEGITDALVPLASVIPGLQVYGYWNDNPTPPSLDVYPGDPFQTGAALGGAGNAEVFFTVRARVSTGDLEAAQKLLLRLLDVQDPASVEVALQDVAVVTQEGVSGLRQYAEDSGASERMLGCEWRVSQFT